MHESYFYYRFMYYRKIYVVSELKKNIFKKKYRQKIIKLVSKYLSLQYNDDNEIVN